MDGAPAAVRVPDRMDPETDPAGGSPNASAPHDPLAVESAGDGDPVNADGGTNGDGGPTGSTLKVPVRRKWREEHDKLALDAIRGAKAHSAAHGQKLKRFEEAADVFNQHPQAIFDVNAKALS